jgi:hypothetical protein
MDFNYLHQYAQETAQELSSKFFQDKYVIEGNTLMSFCSVKQVNFFVLKNLFEEWEKETAKLKSPYFDFENLAVKGALTEFMEKLSFHIRIERKDFEPLLQTAIEETILLVLSPTKYLRSVIIEEQNEFVHLNVIKNQAKYTKFNVHVLQGVIDNMEEKNKDSMLIDELNPVLESLLEDESLNYNIEDFLDEINDLHPLDVVQLLGQEETIGVHENANKTALNDQLDVQAEGVSINEVLKGTDERSLNDELNQGKIESLKSAFGLNQRYLFINKLFEGNEMMFSEAVNKIDHATNYDDAVNYLLDTYSEKFAWGDEESTVAELFGMIDRRF